MKMIRKIKDAMIFIIITDFLIIGASVEETPLTDCVVGLLPAIIAYIVLYSCNSYMEYKRNEHYRRKIKRKERQRVFKAYAEGGER